MVYYSIFRTKLILQLFTLRVLRALRVLGIITISSCIHLYSLKNNFYLIIQDTLYF